LNFSVTILGSGSAIPTSRRNPTAQYVQVANRHILIDCAEGTQMQLRKYGIKFQRLDIILISHLHGDHYFGLFGLLSTLHLLGRVKPITIYGPRGLDHQIDTVFSVSRKDLAYDIDVIELEDNGAGVCFEDEKVRIEHFPLDHKITTHGYLITEKQKERTLLADKAKKDGVKIEFYQYLKRGEDVTLDNGGLIKADDYTLQPAPEKSYAYCSDTAYSDVVVEAVKSVDLLYHEATFIELLRDRANKTRHSTAKDAALVAKNAGVGQLLIGHLSARYDSGEDHLKEAKMHFEHVTVVEDGQVFDV
jgi:ribonuclease Z